MTQQNPAFPDILALLNALVPANDANIQGAPHGAFWRPNNKLISYADFIALKSDDWGVPGSLVVPGSPQSSNFYLALGGLDPFDGTLAGQMPDTAADPSARRATTDELAMVETWIKNNAPEK